MAKFAFKCLDKWANVMLALHHTIERMINSIKKVRLFKCIGVGAIEKTIKEGTTKLTPLGLSNDPMEFRPSGNENQLLEWHKYIEEKRPLVLCLSTKYSSPPMWAHYADNHKGAAVAFEFDIQKSFKILLPPKYGLKEAFLYIHVISEECFLIKCVYCKKRVTIPLIGKEVKKIHRKCQKNPKKVLNDTCFLVFQMAALKGTEWAYENEYRLVYMLDSTNVTINNVPVVSCFKDNIRGILIGYNNKEEKMIKEMADKYRPDVWVRKMDCSPDEFEMACEDLPNATKELEEIEKEAEEIDVHQFIDKVLCDIHKPLELMYYRNR